MHYPVFAGLGSPHLAAKPHHADTATTIWNAKVNFSCYIYFVGHIFICWCILFFWLCYIPFVVAYIYLSLSNSRFLCAVFICWCKLFFFPASFQFVYAWNYLLGAVFRLSCCFLFGMLATSGADIVSWSCPFV